MFMDLVSRHPPGAYDFEAPPRFLRRFVHPYVNVFSFTAFLRLPGLEVLPLHVPAQQTDDNKRKQTVISTESSQYSN
jgi:hypothetical protein